MRLLRAWLIRFGGLFSRQRRERELNDEIESHFALHIEDNIRAGMSLAEARRAAILKFGGVEAAKESYRDRRSVPFLEILGQDLRYAMRTLRKNPGFAAVAIATLALGIGANTAMFSVVQAVLLRPLPYPQPDRLVEITETNPLKRWTHNVVAPANYADWRRMNTVFRDIAAYAGVDDKRASIFDFFLTGSGDPQRLRSILVTGNLFDVLGAAPLTGRVFTDQETFGGHERVAVLSYGLWQTQFAGDPHVIGRKLLLSGKTYDVVGVMPRDFVFPGRDVQIYLPLGVQPAFFVQMRRPHMLNVIGRLKPSVSLDEARAQMSAIARRLEQTYPATNTKMGVRLDGFHTALTTESRPALLMLLAAVALLLLIVCSNVANLQLGRAAAREREMGIRRALGAGRFRLVRQLLTESTVIALAGGALGLILAMAARAALLRLAPAAIPGFAELRIDRWVILFNGLITLCAPLLFGIGPAIAASRPDTLRDRSESDSHRHRVVRDLLVICEVALSVVLVAGAGLLVRSLILLDRVDPGFRPENAIGFHLRFPQTRYPDDDHCIAAIQSIENRLRAMPHVHAAGATSSLPFQGQIYTGDATVEGSTGDYERELRHDLITPEYFHAVGTPLLGGRSFNEFDTAKSPSVTVVNEALARTYFHGADPIGRRIRFGRPSDHDPWTTIVGVVADAKQDGLDVAVQPEAWTAITQQANNEINFVLRGDGDTAVLAVEARHSVREFDKDLVLTAVAPLTDLLHDAASDQRFRTTLLTGFAGIALFLAALGVYGVLAYSVAQRTKEIGVRIALGAGLPRLFGMVLRDGLRPVAAGAVLGLAGAWLATGMIRSLLFGLVPADPVTYAFTVVILSVAAACACAIPAVKAIRVDPVVSLREQ